MSTTQNAVKFHDGRSAPQLGLGVWQVADDITADVVGTALKEGYRLVDTAAIYGNEKGVGRGIADSGVAREELFITTKLWNDKHGHDSTPLALQESLERLGLDYVDLYLIHWPVPAQKRYVQAWEAMLGLRDEGRARSIGVSNFTVSHLQRLLDETGVLPVVNQIELHPRFQQAELREFHAEHGIQTQAWSPLGRGALWEDPVLAGIALKYGRSVAQVMIRWHIQLGNMVIPKSVTPARIRENFQVYDFALDDADMAAIATLDRVDGRSGPDPETFGMSK
ncbi:aldo/keto reductase [Candidimonas nitroreducens]|uniref:Oxidoreductase n=1 Tax=Candidimonas nitroreducens TaxID=683354 RepID=A0A225MRZ8_9BURK|nr:aldo/keto reductase [Candidimonas nitroreducens]OWT64107.1 oxidoreductase [Candidimonas nitroreducens]